MLLKLDPTQVNEIIDDIKKDSFLTHKKRR